MMIVAALVGSGNNDITANSYRVLIVYVECSKCFIVLINLFLTTTI